MVLHVYALSDLLLLLARQIEREFTSSSNVGGEFGSSALSTSVAMVNDECALGGLAEHCMDSCSVRGTCWDSYDVGRAASGVVSYSRHCVCGVTVYLSLMADDCVLMMNRSAHCRLGIDGE